MKTSTPNQKAPQPEQNKKAAAPPTYPPTIERISLPDDVPQDDRTGCYRVTTPKATSAS